MPTPEDGGRTYTFRLKAGIYFADDPAFGGKRRELTAADAAYAIKRLRDPRNRAPYAGLFQDNPLGLDTCALLGSIPRGYVPAATAGDEDR